MYAKYLQPLEQYNEADIAKLENDPLYKEFLEHKAEAMKHGEKMMEAIERDDASDIFKYKKPNVDMYFDDDCCGSWNSTPLDWNMNPRF